MLIQQIREFNVRLREMLKLNEDMIASLEDVKQRSRFPTSGDMKGVSFAVGVKPIICYTCSGEITQAMGSEIMVWDISKGTYVSGMRIIGCPHCGQFIHTIGWENNGR